MCIVSSVKIIETKINKQHNIGPDTAPQNFNVSKKQSKLLGLIWSAPTTPNGVITEYQLQCSGGGQVFNRTVMETTTTLSGLLPYTNYSCSITAHTSAGGGPEATTSVITEEDSEFAPYSVNSIVTDNFFHSSLSSEGCESQFACEHLHYSHYNMATSSPTKWSYH